MENEMNPEFAALLEKANAGDIAAMIKVGNALRNGNKRMAVKADFRRGIEWLEKAAKQGSIEAMRFLANAYHREALAGAYFNFGASERMDYWNERIREATANRETSTSPVLIGKGKKRIGRQTFADRSDLVHIEIAPKVESIGYSAFENCTELESVVIPPSVTSIEFRAFSGCKKLRKVIFAEGLVTISEEGFCGCENLESISFPNSLKEIGTDAFRCCSHLSQITFGSGVKKIGCAAFRECKSLKQVELPDSVDTLEQAVFEHCTELEQIKLPARLERFGWSMFEGCTALKTIELPAVKMIECHAFKDCSQLQSVIAHSPIEEIDRGAFYNCTSLTQIVFPEGMKSLDLGIFENCTSLRMVEVPSTVTKIGHECFKNCMSLEKFVGGQNAQYSSDVFAGCCKLSDIVFDGVLIYSAAQAGCVSVPEGVTRIVDCAFYNRPGITLVELPKTLEMIGGEAFYRCTGLQEVLIPNSVKSIGRMAFQGCAALTHVSLPEEMETIPLSLFEDCERLATVSVTGHALRSGLCELPSAVKLIGSCSFKGCSFEKLALPSAVTEIENWAFAHCTKMSEVKFPKSLQKIGYKAFEGCAELKKAQMIYQVDPHEGDVDMSLFAGCAIDDATIPCYLENEIDNLFGDHIPSALLLVYQDGTIRPWVREEKPEDRAFFAENGFHKYEIKYSYEPACDFYAGCRIKSPANESRSVVVPAKYKDGDTRELAAKISAKGASKTYSISAGDDILESYSLQRDAKRSKFWPVFAALAAYKPEAKK